MPPSELPEDRKGDRAILKAAEARAREDLSRRADTLVRDNPSWSTAVAAYLADAVGPAADAPAPIEEALRAARIELATVHDLLHSLGDSTPLREALRHELTRTSTMHEIAAELQRLGEKDTRLEEVSMRRNALVRLLDEWNE